MAHFYSSLLLAITTRSRWALLLLLVAARGMALAQTITSLAPASGPVGTTVTITGTNLSGAISVRFNGIVQSTILSNTATSLAVAVPAGATTGLVTVTTAAGTSSGRSFTVTAVPLAITAVVPTANARNAAVGSPVSATFNQTLASTSASALKVYSAQRGGLRTRGTTPGVVSGSTLAYTPPQPWVAGETVQSTVTTAATGSAGGTLTKAKVVQFTAAVAGTGRGIFSGTTNYSIPVSNGNTDYLAMGDVDGDGDLDMLTANDNPNGTVSVRFNNGTGTFSGSQSVTVDGFPRVVKLADVDGDGDLDFLAVNDRSSTANSAYGSSVSVRFNNGAGIFSGTQNVETGDFSYGLAIGDLDGDGDLDFATANYSSTDVRVRLNNGTGTFSAGVTISLPNIYPQAVAMGDVDGDGDLDMLSSGGSGTVSVLLNNGNATFSVGTSASAYADYHLLLGDVDGDNDLDLVAAAQNSNNVQIRLNNGAGVFSGGQNVSVTTGPRGVALGDLDADGDLDLVTNNIGRTTNYGNTVSVRFNNGAGVFSAQATTPDLVVGTLPWHVALADIDGDNDLDVLTANNNSTVSLRFNGLVTAPTITSVAPASGPVGTLVTVTGTDLANATAVKLNGVAITSYTVVNTATLTFTVPAGATSGLITVTTPLGTATSATPFTVTVPNAVPTVTSVSPSSVLVNSGAFTLTVNGTGFVSGSVVNFLRGAVPTTFVSATQLTAAISAADLTDLADFNVTVTSPAPGGGTSGGARFQVYLPAPTITSFTPASGPVGTTVTVQGTNFQLVRNVGLVAANNPYATVYTVVDPTTITFTVPAGSASGLVGVTTASGTATSATNFTVTASNPVPTLTALSPATAVAGSGALTLTVSGTGFLANSVVSFNGTALPTTYVSPTQLTAAVPATAVATAGSFAVRVTSPAPGGGASAALTFVVTTPAPTITSFTPSSGPAGTTVTLTGTNFAGATTLTLNGTAITGFTVVNATTLTFVVPAGASSGLLAVSTPGGTATSTTAFTVIVPNPAPTLVALSPATAVAGSGAFTLVVSGTNFIATSVISFNGIALPTTYLSATQLSAVVPASAVAVVGQYTVAVVNAAPGGGTSSAQFTVTAPAPTITSFTPASGLVGTLVTVMGTNFAGATTLTLNGVTIASFTVVNATTLTFVVPAGASSGLLAVSTPSGTATSTTAFTVIVPNPVPTLTALSPATAVAGSGALTLTVSGTGFLASSVVSFNGTALPTTYVSPTQLTAAVPATAVATAGSFAVRVTSPAPGGGASAALTFVVTTPAPTIISFTPAGGSAGTAVTITGTNFTGATEVRIGSSAIPTFTVVSATNITLVIPSGFTASGLITVTTPGGTATSATPFGLILATTSGHALPELGVYPNPFQTTLTVALPNSDAAQVTLRDATGRLVLSSRPLPVSRQLLLPADLATGVYFLEVRQGDLTTTRRVVKQ